MSFLRGGLKTFGRRRVVDADPAMTAIMPCNGRVGEAHLLESDPPLTEYRDAIYVPKRPHEIYDTDETWGLYASDGRPIPEAAYRRGPGPARVGGGDRTSTTSPAIAMAADRAYLYAGPISPHFGHFLLSSLARLWPLLAGRGNWSILYHGDLDPEPWFAEPFVGATLRPLGLGPSDFVRFVGPVRIPAVTVPGPSFEEMHVAYRAHARLGAALGTSLLAGAVRRPSGVPVYLSKSRLASGVWHVVNEEPIVERLARAGIGIACPEALPLAQQVRLFADHRLVLGLTGSGFHTSLLCPQPNVLIGLGCRDPIASNFDLVDRLKGNRSTYVHVRELELLDPGGGFGLAFKLRDPVAVAEDLLRLVDRELARPPLL